MNWIDCLIFNILHELANTSTKSMAKSRLTEKAIAKCAGCNTPEKTIGADSVGDVYRLLVANKHIINIDDILIKITSYGLTHWMELIREDSEATE